MRLRCDVMTDAQLYTLLVWGMKAAGGLGLLAAVVLVIRRLAPEFPEDDGERM